MDKWTHVIIIYIYLFLNLICWNTSDVHIIIMLNYCHNLLLSVFLNLMDPFKFRKADNITEVCKHCYYNLQNTRIQINYA